jgi:antitoxin component of MazEF toxin-antitoxin module
MKFETKMKRIGNSLAIIVPSSIAKFLDLDTKELVEIDIQKINLKSVYCPSCNELFIHEDNINYICPFCKTELSKEDGVEQ